MPTALTVTPQPATATRPPSMLLQVTGAPNPPANAYASNFAAGVDGWANVANAVVTQNAGTTPASLRVQGPATGVTAGTAGRALTGLTVGATYRYKGTATQLRGDVMIRAVDTASGTVLASTSWLMPSSPSNKTIPVSIDFVPTAAAVTIQILVRQSFSYQGSVADYSLHTITVQPISAWLGTTIYRTDVNGTDVAVREDVGGLDVAGGTMTLTDWEAALVGPVTYRVVDGMGAAATAGPVSHAPEVRRNTFINPVLSTGLTGWAATTGASGTGSAARMTSGGPVVDGRELAYQRLTWATVSTGLPASTGHIVGNPNVTQIRVDPAKPFSMSMLGRTSSSDRSAQLVVTFHDAANAQLAVFTGPATKLPTGVWTPVEISGLVVPATAVRAYVRLYGAAGGALWLAGDTFDATAATPELTATAGPAFSGDTPPSGATSSYWVAAAGNSESVQTGELAGPAWLLIPGSAVPSAGAAGAPACQPVPLVTGYEAAAESIGELQDVIGRVDPVGSPGPLSTRAGALELFELDYIATKAVRVLLAAGDVAQLRQPAHAGLDLYLLAGRVDEQPQDEVTTPRRWQVRVDFREVKP